MGLKKHMLILFVLLSPFLNAPHVDPTFNREVMDFRLIYSELNPNFDKLYLPKLNKMTITLGNLPGSAVGECVEDEPRYIVIDKKAWEEYGWEQRRVLMFHELGHCIFSQDHRELEYEDKCPKSIMNPYIMSSECYSAHAKDLIPELPTGKPFIH